MGVRSARVYSGKVFKQIEQLQRIHRLIAAGRTGQPDDFARKLGISTRRLHDILDELRSRGVPIRYCHVVKNYFFPTLGGDAALLSQP
ncbi:MAG: hypothetical protein FWE99_06955 [Bacteroidales bacterium]|nr:hypothetical protein [Bacteroidales bacterium]